MFIYNNKYFIIIYDFKQAEECTTTRRSAWPTPGCSKSCCRNARLHDDETPGEIRDRTKGAGNATHTKGCAAVRPDTPSCFP